MTRFSDQNDTGANVTVTAQTKFDPETDSACEELLSALPTIGEAQPNEGKSLASTIEPDALDAPVTPRGNGMPCEGSCSIEFEDDSQQARVRSDGIIVIRSSE